MEHYWPQDLVAHYQQLAPLSLVELFAQQPERAREFSLTTDGLYYDFSKNNITHTTLE